MKKALFLLSMAGIALLLLSNFGSCKKRNQDILTFAIFGPEDALKISNNEVTISSFRGDNLKNLTEIPATYQGNPVTTIAPNLFNYEKLLKSRIIKDSVNKYLKTTLLMETIKLSANIKTIGSGAFAIPSLREIKSLNPTPPNLGNGVFATNQVLVIYVPAQSLEAYQAQWTTDKIGTTNIEWKTL